MVAFSRAVLLGPQYVMAQLAQGTDDWPRNVLVSLARKRMRGESALHGVDAFGSNDFLA